MLTDAGPLPRSRTPVAAQLRTYTLLAFALTWGIGGLALLVGRWRPDWHPLSTSSPLYYLAGYSVSLAGIALTARYAGREGLRDLARRLAPWRAAPGWYLIVVGGYAAITVGTLLVSSWLHATPAAIPGWSWPLTALIPAIVTDPGPVGEEFGWRGFALPRLLERYAPLHASIRLGLIHTAWHLPLFFIPGMPQTQVSLPLFTVGVLAIAIFDTALYRRTPANLLLAILVHLLANVCGGLAASVGALHLFFVAEGLAAVLVVVTEWSRWRRPTGRASDRDRATPGHPHGG
jgi:CAAX protease family protein